MDLPTVMMKVSEFWLSVDRRGPDECWPWLGYVEKGYGRWYWDGKMRGAHEMALTFTTGEVRLPHLQTCHSCDNPTCVNPAHLRFDTAASNTADKIHRGRQNNPKKITDAQVVVIRERRQAGATGTELARQFGVSPGLINEIVRGHRRKDVGGPVRTEHGNTRHGRYRKKKK